MAWTAERKEKVLAEVKNVSLVTFGCLILAFADAVFLVPRNIVHGGVDSISMIIQHLYTYFNPSENPVEITDITIGILNVFFWLLGLIFFGWKFSARTLLGTLLFPIFYSIFLRCNLVEIIGLESQLYSSTDAGFSLGVDLLAGIFGGLLCGLGVGFTFLGNGSSGGVDVIALLIAKHTSLSEDVASFLVDGTVVILGLCFIQDWISFLVGLLAAFIAAMGVTVSYLGFRSYVVCEIISEKYEDIQKYIHGDLDHASTLIDVTGGYTGNPRKLLKVVIHRRELTGLKNKIASLDPNAFVAFSQAKAINGEGFDPLSSSSVKERSKRFKKLFRSSKETTDDSSEEK